MFSSPANCFFVLRKRGVAGLESWEGGMARTKQWKKERYSVGLEKKLNKIFKKMPPAFLGIFFVVVFQVLSTISLFFPLFSPGHPSLPCLKPSHPSLPHASSPCLKPSPSSSPCLKPMPSPSLPSMVQARPCLSSIVQGGGRRSTT